MNYFTIYKIPKKAYCVQFIDTIEKWEKLEKIDYNIPCVIVFNERTSKSICHKFIVVYKGMMQRTGGSGACFNPSYKGIFLSNMTNLMDNTQIKTHARHMRQWEVFSYYKLLKMVAFNKFQLLTKEMNIDFDIMFLSDYSNYSNIIDTITKLDYIGMGILPASSLTRNRTNRKQLLLN